MTYRIMTEADISTVLPLYMEYYNCFEGGQWTEDTTYKRIHQVWSHEDALCLLALENGKPIGFCMGHFEQYDDLKAYDLIEIVIAHPFQKCGYGSRFMLEIERQVKELGGSMIQLQAVNDDLHNQFYAKLNYQDCNNLVLKSKFL